MLIPEVLLLEIANQAQTIHHSPQPDYVPFDPQGDIVEAIGLYRVDCVAVLEGDEWNNPEAITEAQADHLTSWASQLTTAQAMAFIGGELYPE